MWSLSRITRSGALLAGLTEHAFLDELGIGDPPSRRLHLRYASAASSTWTKCTTLHDVKGRRLEESSENDDGGRIAAPEGRTRPRSLPSHWRLHPVLDGCLSEAVKRLRHAERKDHFIDYCEQGKTLVLLASTLRRRRQASSRSSRPARLSDEFHALRLRPEPGPSRVGKSGVVRARQLASGTAIHSFFDADFVGKYRFSRRALEYVWFRCTAIRAGTVLCPTAKAGTQRGKFISVSQSGRANSSLV